MKLTRSTSATFWKAEKIKEGPLRRSKSLPQVDELTEPDPNPRMTAWGPRLYIAHLLPEKLYPKCIAREHSVEDLTTVLLPAVEIIENKHRPPRRFPNNSPKVRNYTPSTQYGSILAEPASLSPSYKSSTSSTSCTVFSSGGSRRQLSSGGTVPPAFLREPSPPTTWHRLQQVLNQVSRCKKPVAEFFEKLQRPPPARREAAGPRFIATG